MRISGYSPQTIKAYTLCIKNLRRQFQKPLSQVSEREFKAFLDNLARKRRSPYTLNLYHASLKYVIEKVYKRPFSFHFPYTKRHKKLPIVLSKKEITKIINSAKNPKHKLLIALSYGSGLRAGEVVSLKTKDIDLDELVIHIKQAKGKKERITIIPKKLQTKLQKLLSDKKADDFVF